MRLLATVPGRLAAKFLSGTLTVLAIFVIAGWVILNTFNSCVTVEAETPTTSELATDENIRGLVQTIVNLHDRIAALEAQQLGHLYPDATHTHSNDHYHGLSDNFLDEGYHTHSEYAESDHEHWGYAEEFHSHDRGW